MSLVSLVCGSAAGFDNQLRAAVDNLSVAERILFDRRWPEWEHLVAVSEHPTLSSFDTESAGLDPDYPCWVAEWIEDNTDMFWEDSELWELKVDS